MRGRFWEKDLRFNGQQTTQYAKNALALGEGVDTTLRRTNHAAFVATNLIQINVQVCIPLLVLFYSHRFYIKSLFSVLVLLLDSKIRTGIIGLLADSWVFGRMNLPNIFVFSVFLSFCLFLHHLILFWGRRVGMPWIIWTPTHGRPNHFNFVTFYLQYFN